MTLHSSASLDNTSDSVPDVVYTVLEIQKKAVGRKPILPSYVKDRVTYPAELSAEGIWEAQPWYHPRHPNVTCHEIFEELEATNQIGFAFGVREAFAYRRRGYNFFCKKFDPTKIILLPRDIWLCDDRKWYIPELKVKDHRLVVECRNVSEQITSDHIVLLADLPKDHAMR